MTIQTTARNADLGDLARILQVQEAAKLDIVAPFTALRSEHGVIRVSGTSVFDDDGGFYRPTSIADGHLAEKLQIPVQYLRRLREQRPDLYDVNVNGLIHGDLVSDEAAERLFGPDGRNVLVRLFQGEPDEEGVLRSVQSDKYQILDNFDILTSALAGAREASTSVEVLSCDLSERRMAVKLIAPELVVPDALTPGYRSPFGGTGVYDHSGGVSRRWGKGQLPEQWQQKYGADANGLIAAGIRITNSETGDGAFGIAPYLTWLACTNGAVITDDIVRQVHLGSKLDQGIAWTQDTQKKALELVTAQARDAVQAFLSADYLQSAVDQLAEKAGKRLADAGKTIEVVGKQLGWSEADRADILGFFIEGGVNTAGGVLQAVTAHAQSVESPDASYELENSALKALELAFAAA